MSAGGGLETSGWADRAHTHCRCPSPYHSATLTHTERERLFNLTAAHCAVTEISQVETSDKHFSLTWTLMLDFD